MNSSNILLALPCALAISMLSGCAAPVKSGGTEALAIQDSAKRNLVLNLQGTSKVQQNEDWPQLKQEWKEALQYEATKLDIACQRLKLQVQADKTALASRST
ncbi:hypothetical protein [Pseudomonas fragi]|uniref:hypothetical protein n=1 Tax=Pseudomonas fragi TaxID=296 RepID=UPI001EEEC19A|nr:hypothetical protein [Pseudomonas fragi]